MSWSKGIKDQINKKTASVGAQVKTAGVFSQQSQQRDQFREEILRQADQQGKFSGVDSQGRPVTGKPGTMFDSRGEFNAWDKKDLLNQIDYANHKASEVRQNAWKKASDLTYEEKESFLDHIYSNDSQERLKYAQQPISIVYDRLDYIGMVSDMLQQMELRPGTIPAVERDVNVPAMVVAEDAQSIRTDVKGQRIFFDEFQLTSLVTASVMEVNQRSYAIIDRIFEKVPRQIALEEDRVFMRALKAASSVKNNNIVLPSGTIDKNTIEQMALQIERWRLDADKFLLNRKDFSDIRTSIRADEFDPITSREVFISGYMGKYYDYDLYVTAGIDEDQTANEVVPPGHIFAVAGPRFLGYQAVRVPLDVFDANQFVNADTRYGWLYYKLQGMLISNPRSVVFAHKDPAKNPTPAWLK